MKFIYTEQLHLVNLDLVANIYIDASKDEKDKYCIFLELRGGRIITVSKPLSIKKAETELTKIEERVNK